MCNDMILADNIVLPSGYKKNMNCLIIGVPGSGKTRSHVLPNLCNMDDSSAILLDPKGELYSLTAEMMRSKGYSVKLLDFDDPDNPDSSFYNPLRYCKTTDDILSLSKLLVSEDQAKTKDSFWPNSAQVLANALIGYLVYETNMEDRTLEGIVKLLKTFSASENSENKSTLDIIFDRIRVKNPDAWHLEQYDLFKKVASANTTTACIVMSLIVTFAGFMSSGIKRLTSKDTINLKRIGRRKTILYVKSSDSDRSRDRLVSILFQQVFKELFNEADSQPDHSLKVHTHLYLDDIGTNLTIDNLDGYIAACRSREISVSVILQSVGQLEKQFGRAYTAILGSCASLVFLGSNDINTCHEMSLRLNKPLGEVLYKDRNDIYVFTQGEAAKKAKVYDVTTHPNYKMIADFKSAETER